ncbi:hypothetical protein B484DRAFT_397837 [Ochromonadaceae sp. CCMP2298]|nr:hypothetical protein B484DRAFT_397837 [Ochromonadaceae sp. CCMP2298]
METQRYLERREVEFSNEELKQFIAANSKNQLRLEIVHVTSHGNGFFPMLQMVQILSEKGGWDPKSWTKELDSGRQKVGTSFLDAAIHSWGGFSDEDQLCMEFLLLAGCSVTKRHRTECASCRDNGCGDGEVFNQDPYLYIFDKCSASAAKRSRAFLDGAVDFALLHGLPSKHAKMLYVHGLFTSTCCTAWDETQYQDTLDEGEGFQTATATATETTTVTTVTTVTASAATAPATPVPAEEVIGKRKYSEEGQMGEEGEAVEAAKVSPERLRLF